MKGLLNNLFNLEQYESTINRTRARMIYVLLTLILLFMTSYAVFVRQWGSETEPVSLMTLIFQAGIINEVVLFYAGLYIFGIATYILTRIGRLNWASWGLVATWLVGGVWLNLAAQPRVDAASSALFSLLLLGALLRSQMGLAVTTGLSLVSMVLAIVLRSPEFIENANIATLTLSLLSNALILYLFVEFFRLSVSENVSEAIDERQRATTIMTEVTRLVAQREKSSEVAQLVTDAIARNFSFIYQAKLYLVQEGGVEARLVAQTIISDNLPLQTLESASLGGLSPIGQVALNGDSIIETIERRVTEAVLPMRIGTRIIGVLCLRTQDSQRFRNEVVIDAFQALANNVGLALDGVNQYERAEERLRENDRLVERTNQALREVERLNQRLTGSAWSQFLRRAEANVGLDVNFEDDTAIENQDWTQTLSDAAKINTFIQEQNEDKQIIALPLRVRGQIVGAMEFELDAEREFTPNDLDLIQEVGERFGLAVENTRLVQESQRVAQREALVNQITSRIQSSNDMQNVLRDAANGLREALKADRVAIKLGQTNTTPPANSKNGGKSS